MTHLTKIATVLANCSKDFGVTASMIAKKTHVPRNSVRKRIHELRSEGYSIHTNYRKINGVRKAYYLMSTSD
jgi:biotin operon repressor